MDNKLTIDAAEIEALSDLEAEIAFHKTLQVLGVKFRYVGDFVELIDCTNDELLGSEEFIEEYSFQLKRRVIKNAFEHLENEGLIKIVGVDDNGEYRYGLA